MLIINHKRNKKTAENGKDVEDMDRKDDDSENEKLFDYEGEDTYLNEENLEKLNQVYTNQIDGKEKIEDENNFEELKNYMKSKEKHSEEKDLDKNIEEPKIEENQEVDYEILSSEVRKEKLAQLEKEIKEKNNRNKYREIKKNTKENDDKKDN